MEKLKCSSCGGEIIVDDDKEYGTCSYCGTKYKLKKDINLNIKIDDNTKEVINNGIRSSFSWIIFIPIILISIIFVIMFFNINNADKVINNYDDEEKDNSFEKNRFNLQFFGSNGTNNSFFLEHTLDEIVQSNKTHDRIVTLVFNGQEFVDENEIIGIKHSLSGNYEVSLNYDDEGYINKIIVDKID